MEKPGNFFLQVVVMYCGSIDDSNQTGFQRSSIEEVEITRMITADISFHYSTFDGSSTYEPILSQEQILMGPR